MERAELDIGKGWCVGPWKSALPISVGLANRGIDEPQFDRQVTEIYLVARGTSVIRGEHQTLELRVDDVVVIEPREAHTFLSSSSDYLHFVPHVPGRTEVEASRDQVSVPRSSLGL